MLIPILVLLVIAIVGVYLINLMFPESTSRTVARIIFGLVLFIWFLNILSTYGHLTGLKGLV